MTPTAPWICPECSGPWVRNFVFDHDRATCTLGKAEDATHYADYERLRSCGILERPATPTEIALGDVIRGYPLLRAAQFVSRDEPAPVSRPAITVVTMLTHGIHYRVVTGVDPDKILEES